MPSSRTGESSILPLAAMHVSHHLDPRNQRMQALGCRPMRVLVACLPAPEVESGAGGLPSSLRDGR